MPKIIARVVMRMGRNRTRAAPIRASRRATPCRRWTLVKSITRMAFLVTRPINRISPIIDIMFNVSFARYSKPATPINDSGSDSMIAKGCRKLRNWLARMA